MRHRYRDIITTYHYERYVPNTDPWTDWSENPISDNGGMREAETQKQYHYEYDAS